MNFLKHCEIVVHHEAQRCAPLLPKDPGVVAAEGSGVPCRDAASDAQTARPWASGHALHRHVRLRRAAAARPGAHQEAKRPHPSAPCHPRGNFARQARRSADPHPLDAARRLRCCRCWLLSAVRLLLRLVEWAPLWPGAARQHAAPPDLPHVHRVAATDTPRSIHHAPEFPQGVGSSGRTLESLGFRPSRRVRLSSPAILRLPSVACCGRLKDRGCPSTEVSNSSMHPLRKAQPLWQRRRLLPALR